MLRVLFKDAFRWWEARLLKAYGCSTVAPKQKRKKFSDLKRRAPKIPDYTCPIIDQVLDQLSSNPNIRAGEYRKLKSKMERIRRMNDKLRSSGVYWYEIAKAVFQPK